MWSTILLLLKPLLAPLISFIAGYLLPSPMQKAARRSEEIHNAEQKADATRGYVDDLDNLP